MIKTGKDVRLALASNHYTNKILRALDIIVGISSVNFPVDSGIYDKGI